MPPVLQTNRKPRHESMVRRFAWNVLVLAGALALAVWGLSHWAARDDSREAEITATVARADLPIAVTERGDLESSKTVEVHCEVEGEQTKIVEILPEGTRVSEGQVVVRFDTDKLSRSYAEQEIKWRTAAAKAKAAEEDLEVQKNKSASEIAKAKLTLKLAEIDLRKYFEGEYLQEKRNIEGEMLVADEELKRAEDRLESSQRLNKKNYVSDAEVEADHVAVTKAKNTRDVAKEKLRVLEQFTRVRQEASLTADAEEAVRELERTQRSQAALIAKMESDYEGARDTANIEKAQLDRLGQQLGRCVIKAPKDGILVYNKERPWDTTSRIQSGGVVHFQQTLFSLPDLAEMQVKVKIHESAVKKIELGQEAEIRVDAYPNELLHGVVEKVATLADFRGFWDQRGVKEYETIVKIRNLPADAGLKPGMTAEVKILVNHLPDRLIIPVQSVSEKEGEHYSYVVGERGVERRRVSVGDSNEKFVEIKSGLSEGEQVALDARARTAAETNAGKENGNGVRKAPGSEPPNRSAPVAITPSRT